ncbi:HD-GYP domain-containing protein [Aneurinibacillus terranovensis]|uniref:HD-GYP domain-containing protein n=1 Tax=Aneurinibacillus terranovensis TaxID=278991 RepID=UPI00040B72F7|nr:HD domain-containing phosphohydrolase [Aneurinibacillus terranovensis]
MQNHIKSRLRFTSLTAITLTYFIIRDNPTFSALTFWGLTVIGWGIALIVYTWKKKETREFLASNEKVLRVFDFLFVLGYMFISGGVGDSPYLMLIYLGIASIGIYDEKRDGLIYSILAVIVLVLYSVCYHKYWDGIWTTTSHEMARLILLPLFGVLADLLIAHFQQKKREEEEVLDELVTSLAKAIGSKDSYTLGHSTRVQHYALAIGKELGLGKEEMFTLKYGALLHDIGKIHIPTSLLNKPGRLNEQEWVEIRNHTTEGAKIIGSLKKLEGVRDIILHHHEHFNGKGYPEGLKGNEIPFLAAIVHVADAFDAMTTTRSYNQPETFEEAMDEIERCSGTDFHPMAAEAALSAYRKGKWPDFKLVHCSHSNQVLVSIVE